MPSLDGALGRLDHWIVPPVMADKQRHARRFSGLDKVPRRGDVVGDGLFDERGNTGRDGFEAVRDMDLIGGRDD